MKRCRTWITAVALVVFCGVAVFGADSGEPQAPAWTHGSKPISATEIPASDYPYLADWVGRNGKPPQDYVLDLFKKHDVVICGEAHNVKEHKDFIVDLIPRLYHETGVHLIAWEFSQQADNERLEKLITVPLLDREAVLNFARDQSLHEWDSKEHWDIIEAVWKLNQSLGEGQPRVRLIGVFPWSSDELLELVKLSSSASPESPEYGKLLKYVRANDALYAKPVDEEVLAKGNKALVFVGRSHDFTHHEFPADKNFGREIMANVLYKKYGERVFQVWLAEGFLPPIRDVMALRKHEPVGFDLYDSPFANILSPAGWDAANVPLGRIARGFVYLGDPAGLHKNTPIKGFVTPEMFEKYREIYAMLFGRKFTDAEDVDRFLEKNRFSKPK